ncbi:MAG: diacylglycerol kinase family protein, partial [Actinobacteria bacterium]|nr:diacylglycerol kinase family protein [Actinomycetota bacterium]
MNSISNEQSFTFSGRLRSIRFALYGLKEVLITQHNAWIHLCATAITIIAAMFLRLSMLEWCVLALAITLVWVAEALNTAFEVLCDVASPEFHPLVKKSKDVAAAAVLLSAVGAILIGALIFGPKL